MTPKDCSNCQMTAAATAPGATSRTDSCRAAAKRNPKKNTAMLIITDATSAATRRTIPTAPTPLPPAMDKAVVPIMASPAVASSSRLRPRALKGFAGQHEAEDRREQQQQREQRYEPVVGEQRRQVGPKSSTYLYSTASGNPAH